MKSQPANGDMAGKDTRQVTNVGTEKGRPQVRGRWAFTQAPLLTSIQQTFAKLQLYAGPVQAPGGEA